MFCDMCKKMINDGDGYFSTLIHQDRLNFHINCRPMFFYNNNKDEKQLPLFKEKKNE